MGIIILLCGFMGVGFLLMNAALITRIRESFYRETGSNSYHGALFPIAYLLVELVWLAVLCLEVTSIEADDGNSEGVRSWFAVLFLLYSDSLSMSLGWSPSPSLCGLCAQAMSVAYFLVGFGHQHR